MRCITCNNCSISTRFHRCTIALSVTEYTRPSEMDPGSSFRIAATKVLQGRIDFARRYNQCINRLMTRLLRWINSSTVIVNMALRLCFHDGNPERLDQRCRCLIRNLNSRHRVLAYRSVERPLRQQTPPGGNLTAAKTSHT